MWMYFVYINWGSEQLGTKNYKKYKLKNKKMEKIMNITIQCRKQINDFLHWWFFNIVENLKT